MNTMPSPAVAAAARRARAAQGYFTSGTVPYGYERDRYHTGPKKDALIVPVPVEAARVKWIFRLYLRHRSIRKVLREIEALGITSPRGGKWKPAQLNYMLRNQTYIGRVSCGDVNVIGKHEAIVAPIVFWKAGALLRKNDKRRRKSTAERLAG